MRTLVSSQDPRWKQSAALHQVNLEVERTMAPILAANDPKKYTDAQAEMVRRYKNAYALVQSIYKDLSDPSDTLMHAYTTNPAHLQVVLADEYKQGNRALNESRRALEDILDQTREAAILAEEWCKAAGSRTFGNAYTHWNWPDLH